MLLPRRSPPAPEQAAASVRVRGLLPLRATTGWVPPVQDEPTWSLPAGAAVPDADDAQRPPDADVPAAPPVPDPGVPPAAAPVPSLLDRLRAGRLDPGRRGVLGLAAAGVLACVVAGVVVLRGAPQEVAPPLLERPGRAIGDATVVATATPSSGAQVVVAVAGEVRRPGLVRLPAGSRVDDAVRAAGGPRPGVSVGLLNLARRLVDGEQVVVGGPAPGGGPAGAGGPVAAGPGAGGPGAGAAGPGVLLDLNTATASDLDGLPGIGPVLAERIVDYRTAHGPFRSVDQLREVSGIGESKYASLRDVVTV